MLEKNISKSVSAAVKIFPALSALSLISFLVFSCTGKRHLAEIETRVASPIDVAVSEDSDGNKDFFFVLNADLNHQYSSGSILTIDKKGERKQALKIPRLGRSIKVSGDRLLVTYDDNKGEGVETKVELYQISYGSDGALPELSLKKSWEFEGCRALNSVMRKSYQHFAVTCESGALLLGTFNASNLSESSLVKAREFPSFVRRAMHIDTKRHLLYAFVTDMNTPNLFDRYSKDNLSWDSETETLLEDTPDDIPDRLEFGYEDKDRTVLSEEKSKKQRLNLAKKGSEFQFVIIPLEDPENLDESGQFKFREYKNVQNELHWMYFTAKTKSGEDERPNLSSSESHDQYKYYRSNFWEARADEDASSNPDDRSFFLAHRGKGSDTDSPHSNNLIRVTLNDSINSYSDLAEKKFTKDILSITRVFGFSDDDEDKRQKTENDYLGAFDFTSLEGSSVLVTNNFRSRRDFKKDHFSLKAFKSNGDAGTKYQDKNFAFEQSENSNYASYYQFGLSGPVGSGDSSYVHVLVSSFYDDSVRLLKLDQDSLSEINKFE